MNKKELLAAFAAGAGAALAEYLLLVGFGSVTRLTMWQSLTAWFACGFTVSLARTGLPVLIESVVLTLLLNAAWIIALSYNNGEPQLLAPLLIASAALGIMIGLIRLVVMRGARFTQVMPLLLFAVVATLVIRCGESSPKPAAGVIEIARFRKKAAVAEAEFQVAIRSLDEFASKQPGFISRKTGPDGKGGWVDVVSWRDMQAAEAAMRAAEKSEICARVFAMLDPKFEQIDHVTVSHEFTK